MADEEKKSGSSVGKIVATVFGAVLAPILVGVAVKWGDPAIWKKPPSSQAQAPATQSGGGPPPPPPILHLVTPRLSDYFYSYGWSAKDSANVRNDNVDPALFQYVSTPPSIAVASEGKMAVLQTKNEYENYTLHVDYRWGEKTWGDRETKRRLAAILLHATGTDGVIGIMPQCVSVDISEGLTGTIGLRGLPSKIKGIAKAKEIHTANNTIMREYVGGNAPLLPLVSGEPRWHGGLNRLGYAGYSVYKDVKGWRPSGDPTFADPAKTNKVTIESRNGHLKVFINAKLVNEITGLNVKKGRIGFTSQQADYSLGRIELEVRPEAASR